MNSHSLRVLFHLRKDPSLAKSLAQSWIFWLAACGLLPLGGALRAQSEGPLPESVEFNRDIRPILSDVCYHCHGPDQAKRKADLRLDQEQQLTRDRAGRQAVVPGEPAKSELPTEPPPEELNRDIYA